MGLGDPVIGLLIAAAIRPVLGDAAREVYRQLMEANDSRLVAEAEHCLASTPGATRVGRVRLGWTGHHL